MNCLVQLLPSVAEHRQSLRADNLNERNVAGLSRELISSLFYKTMRFSYIPPIEWLVMYTDQPKKVIQTRTEPVQTNWYLHNFLL